MPVESLVRTHKSRVAWGDVIDATSGSVTVRIAGGTVNTPVGMALTTYTPTAGDRVALLRVGTAAWAILDKLKTI